MPVLEAEPETVGGEVYNVGDTGENFRKLDLVELLEERVPTMQVERVENSKTPATTACRSRRSSSGSASE